MLKIKEIDLDKLPRWEQGEGRGKIGTINWKKSIGYELKFIYNDIKGYVKIKEFDGKFLYLDYLDKRDFKIDFRSFKEGRIGKLIGEITNEFRYEIGTRFQDNKRDITIVDREYRTIINKRGYKDNQKWYKYHCNACGWEEGCIQEGHLKEGNGCTVCSGQKYMQGYNDITTIVPWMIPYFQGGYEEAKLYTKNGGGNPNNKEGKIYPICPDCGMIRTQKTSIGSMYANHGYKCIYCSDGISFPEKYMFGLLKQLDIQFNIHFTPKWISLKEYDFYFELNGTKSIIETHGLQHYEEKGWKTSKSLKEEQENDNIKKDIALSNDIKEKNYIVIDCRYSESEYIRQNILGSRLNELFDLSSINWNEIEKFALGNKVIDACGYKRSNPDLTPQEIANIMGYHHVTIRKWLKKGTKLGWCYYNADEGKSKNMKKVNKLNRKPIEMFKDNVSLGIFESATYLEKHSEELFGVKLHQANISAVCLGQIKHYKKYFFKYV